MWWGTMYNSVGRLGSQKAPWRGALLAGELGFKQTGALEVRRAGTVQGALGRPSRKSTARQVVWGNIGLFLYLWSNRRNTVLPSEASWECEVSNWSLREREHSLAINGPG